jgi:catechol-2,3-dioxygenase
MSVLHIDHYNLRAKREILEELRDFYCTVIGLKVGNRPAFKSFGYWLYAGDKAVLHLSETSPDEIREPNVMCIFHHVAFACDDLQGFETHLCKLGIKYRKAEVPQTGQIQLFLSDPVGNGIELNFSSDTLYQKSEHENISKKDIQKAV